MGIKVTQDMDDVQTTAHMRLLSLVLLGISVFFFLLFFVYWSATGDNALDPISDEPGLVYLYHLLISVTTITITLLVMHFYSGVGRIYSLLKYSIIIGNAVAVSLAINQLTRGYTELFGNDASEVNQNPVMYTFAGLGVGFAGVGTLLCLIHNFYGIRKAI